MLIPTTPPMMRVRGTLVPLNGVYIFSSPVLLLQTRENGVIVYDTKVTLEKRVFLLLVGCGYLLHLDGKRNYFISDD